MKKFYALLFTILGLLQIHPASASTSVFVGIPKSKQDLSRCDVVGRTNNRLYYLRGSSVIFQMIPAGKICFPTEQLAKKNGYKRSVLSLKKLPISPTSSTVALTPDPAIAQGSTTTTSSVPSTVSTSTLAVPVVPPLATPLSPSTSNTTTIPSPQCQQLDEAFRQFKESFELAASQGLDQYKDLLDLFKFSGDFGYGYERMLAKKDSFANLTAQLNHSIDAIPSLSFTSTRELKQSLYSSSNGFQRAFDSLILSAKYASDAVGRPNNGYLVDSAQRAADESHTQSDGASRSLSGALNSFKSIEQAYSAERRLVCAGL